MDRPAYLVERVSLAVTGLDWCVVSVTANDRTDLVDQLGGVSALVIPLDSLAVVGPEPLPVPVLGIGPSDLFESTPPGLCNDLITDRCDTTELRFRLRRMVVPVFRFSDGRRIEVFGFRVTDGERSVTVTHRLRLVLMTLLRARGEEVTRETLKVILQLPDRESRALDVTVSRLRSMLNKLTAAWSAPLRITASRGRGYRLEQPQQEAYHRPVDNS